MMCNLCKAHAGMAPGGRKKAWIDVPCHTLRFDKLQDHENSVMRKFAVKAEVWQKDTQKASANHSSAAKDAAQDALRVICYLIEHNLPLDLVKLLETLGAPNIMKLHSGKNATYTSWDSVQVFLSALSEEVEDTILQDVKASPCFAMMADEVTDVSTSPHRNTNIGVALLSDLTIPNGTAETITKEVKKELHKKGLDMTKMCAFGADGASTFSGKKSGVGLRLLEVNPSLIFQHCRDHRLALACKRRYTGIKVIQKTDDMLQDLHK